MKISEVKALEEQAELAERAANAAEAYQVSLARLAQAEAVGAKARANVLSNALAGETAGQMLDESRDGVTTSPLFGRLISGASADSWKPRLTLG